MSYEYWTLDGGNGVPSGLMRMKKGRMQKWSLKTLKWEDDQSYISHIMGFGTDATEATEEEIEHFIDYFKRNGTPFRDPVIVPELPPTPDARELQIMSVEISTGRTMDESKLAPLSEEYAKTWKKLEVEIAEIKAKGFAVDFGSYQELD